MEKLLCPSMMCTDFGDLKSEVLQLTDADVDMFHCDIMDGNFVPNLTMGINDIKTIRKNTNKIVDCHLMIENPEKKLDWFIDAGVDLIYIHPESERYVIKSLAYIKEKGKLAGLAINPDTSLDTVMEMLHLVDYLMIMTVNPGFAGQRFLKFTKGKIKKAIDLKEQFGFKVMIDGSCSQEIIKEYSYLGVDGFILGTSALFGKEESYSKIIERLRDI